MNRFLLHGRRAGAVLIAAAASAAVSPSAAQAVAKGQPISIEQVPYAAIVTKAGFSAQRGFQCSAAIVAPQVAVTAAHCVTGQNPGRMTVTVGQSTIGGDGGQTVVVDAISRHPDFHRDFDPGDIAALHLAEPVSVPAITMNTDASMAVKRGQALTLAGWGYTTDPTMDRGAVIDGVLHAGRLKVADRFQCRGFFPHADPARQICAGAYNVDACHGDSGGPLIVATAAGPVLVGLVSYGQVPCGVGVPAIYTRISAYASWVAQQFQPMPAPAPGSVTLAVTKVACSVNYRCTATITASGEQASAVSQVNATMLDPSGGRWADGPAQRTGPLTWEISAYNPALAGGTVTAIAVDPQSVDDNGDDAALSPTATGAIPRS